MVNIPKITRPIAENITETVGNTPLVRLNKLAGDLEADVLVKLESFNPISSVKDRVGLGLIEDLEERGLLNKDSTIIEATSGNMGIGLGFVAAQRGYKVIFTMPDTMSMERRKLLAIFGAKIVLTPGSEGMGGAIKKANELLEEIPNSINPGQFVNQANPKFHKKTTAQEILRDTEGKVDIVVAGVGTGGTITGISEAIKDVNPNLKAVAVEPETSPVLSKGTPGAHKIQGIGAGFVPETFHGDAIDEIFTVKDQDAASTLLALAKQEGILAGISSGAATFAALELAKKEENKGKTIVAILPDTGERYLSVDWVFQELYDEHGPEIFPVDK